MGHKVLTPIALFTTFLCFTQYDFYLKNSVRYDIRHTSHYFFTNSGLEPLLQDKGSNSDNV